MVWKKAAEILIDGKVPLTIYHSNRSKLRVLVAETPGPIVDGRITFVTETHSDDGLPHTLEHLVFMGSELYPYKGMLDIIANRCLASGTNAYTDQDNTTHLLEPTLTQSQYMTEVHHINGSGHDSGVVYSEMQDRESGMETMVDRKRKQLFYPKGSSYAAVVGGALSDIRHICSLERVRAFHNNFYHLSNLYITVCGQIDHQKLLDVIDPVEQRNLDSVPKHFAPPFQARIAPLTGPKTERIICPSDDESIGMVEMSWLGPEIGDIHTTRALMILFDYLTDTAVAPMRKDFVQAEDPFCTSVDFHILEQRDCEIIASFEGVPVNKLEKIREHFFEKTVADHRLPDAFDVQRIGFILDQQTRLFHSKLENRSTSLIGGAIVGHQLYGQESDPDYKVMEQYLNEADLLRKFKSLPASFWHSLFHKYLANRNCVCVMAEPSEKMVEEHAEKEEERIKQQIERIGGESGLAICQKNLEEAIEANTCRRPLDDDLKEFIVRDFEKFNMIKVNTSTNLPPHSNGFACNFPFTAIWHGVRSDFVDVNILIDTDGLPVEDRHFLMLWFELMFQSPAVVDGKEISYEEVAKLSTRDLVSNSASVGVSGVYDRFLSLRLRADSEKVGNLSKWAYIYLKGIKLYPDRVAICARNLANNAADSKRDGNSVCHFLNANSTYSTDSNTRFYSYLGLEKFHKAVAKAVADGKSDAVLARLEAVRQKVLTSPLNDRRRMSQRNGDSSGSKNAHFYNAPPTMVPAWNTMAKAVPLQVGGSESAFLLQKTRFDDDWTGPTTMPTLLLAQYMVQSEGPLWCAVRGPVHGTLPLLPTGPGLRKNAGHSDFRTGRGQSTVKLTATSAILATIRSVGNDFTLKLCEQIWHAKAADVLTIGSPALRRLFDPSKSVRSIALNPSRLKELREHFPETNMVRLEDFQVKNVM
uniref:Peptidase M16 C-terminal domain-containing protein n=1 Tax=Globodera rostochiensis TaxID=31243 RepID=A0A914HDR4_GLORO